MRVVNETSDLVPTYHKTPSPQPVIIFNDRRRVFYVCDGKWPQRLGMHSFPHEETGFRSESDQHTKKPEIVRMAEYRVCAPSFRCPRQTIKDDDSAL